MILLLSGIESNPSPNKFDGHMSEEPQYLCCVCGAELKDEHYAIQ